MRVAEAAAAEAGTGEAPDAASRAVGGRAFWALAAVVAVLGFAARAGLFLHGGGLRSFGGYDDGVYYAAADALVHGRMPYRDFLLLHPPVVVLAVAPFAWFGSITSDSLGFAAGRVGFELLGAANAVLVALLLRRRGLVAAAVGGLTYAIFFPAVYAERSTLLEPLGTFGTLLGLLLLLVRPMRTRWAALAGVALGATLAVKIWYVVPTGVVLLIGLAALRGHRPRWALLGGVAVGGGVLYLPFFLPAPGNMWRYVVTDQLSRPGIGSDLPTRLRSMLGLPGSARLFREIGWITPFGATVVACVLVLLLVIVAVWGAPDLATFLFLALLVSGTAVLVLSPSYFQHYATLTAAPLALLVGTAIGVLSRMVDRRVAVAAAAVVVVGVGVVEFPSERHGVGTPMPATAVQAAVARVRGCVMADDPTVLAVTNTLSRNLDRACPLWPDVTGWTYEARYITRRNGIQLSRPKNPRWQAAIVRYLTSGSAVFISRPDTGLSRASRGTLARGRILAQSGGVVLRASPRSRE